FPARLQWLCAMYTASTLQWQDTPEQSPRRFLPRHRFPQNRDCRLSDFPDMIRHGHRYTSAARLQFVSRDTADSTIARWHWRNHRIRALALECADFAPFR